MNLKVGNPNFSIVLPSTCDSNCPFCFANKTESTIDTKKYIKALKATLDKLPIQFTQISITGGEPTLSPLLNDILRVINKKRFPKVVLTTSATKKGRLLYVPEIGKVNHINISRHAIKDEENISIFKNDNIPTTQELTTLISKLNDMGIDVTLNCVLGDKKKIATSIQSLAFNTVDSGYVSWVKNYIKMAKEVNASAVCFRKKQDKYTDLDPTIIELSFDKIKTVAQNSCPVCRSKTQIIDGMRTTWRASLYEPSNSLKGVYELIFQPNTQVTSDWLGKNVETLATPVTRSANSPYSSVGGSSCGNGGGGCASTRAQDDAHLTTRSTGRLIQSCGPTRGC